LGVVLAVVFLWPGRRTGPEPIAYGRDACAECRMILSRPGFAGEVRTADGTLRKYDDVGCLLQAMLRQRGEMPEAWVEDHTDGGLVPLLTATLVRLRKADTPMGRGIVAFADADAARHFADDRAGAIVALEDLVRDPTLLARTDLPAGENGDSR
jgi:copper chaperone NosL